MVTSSKKTLFLLIPAAALVLAGCSPTVAPPAAQPLDCDPADSAISWQPIADFGNQNYVPAGAQVVMYEDGGATRSITAVDYELQTTFDNGAIQQLAGSDDALAATWKDALLTDLERTGQVDQNFGSSPVISDTQLDAEPSEPVDGTFVVGFAVTQVTATFTVECSETGQEVEGSLTAVDGFGTSKVLVDCATPPVEPDALSEDALENCPAG